MADFYRTQTACTYIVCVFPSLTLLREPLVTTSAGVSAVGPAPAQYCGRTLWWVL